MTHPKEIAGTEIPKGYATIPSMAKERGLVRGWESRQGEVDELVDVCKPLLEAYYNMAQQLQTDFQFVGDKLTQRAEKLLAKHKGETE